MTRAVLVLRPEPGATRTAHAARALGLQARIVPLFETRAIAWAPPDAARFDAVMITSAAALRHGGRGLASYVGVPVYAVGAATGEAARAAGFADVRKGDGDAQALAGMLVNDGRTRVLHLCGIDRREADVAGATVERVAVYAAEPIDRPKGLDTALAEAPVALLHSPRAAARLAELVLYGQRMRVTLAAISRAAAQAAGGGWQTVAIADRSDDAAVLAVAARLCEKRDEQKD